MAASDNLNEQQLSKAFISIHRRINNLESRYGGVIGMGPGDSHPDWQKKKQKLINEREALRAAYPPQQQEG